LKNRRKIANFVFDSRRLHIPRYRSVYVGGVGSQVGIGLRPRLTWSTPAASTNLNP